jgi:tyrosine-protein kinase Etk/Wzc
MAKKKISPINEEFDFKLLVTIGQKNLLWLALFILSALMIAYLILRYTPPEYEAVGVLQISEQNNARSVLNDATLKGFNEQNNKVASSIELMRSKVIINRVIDRLPMQVSYFSKGEVLTNELYRNSPYSVEVKVKDSSIIGAPIIIDFKSANTYTIVLPYTGNVVSKPLKANTWINLPSMELNVHILKYNEIQAVQNTLGEDGLFFKINDKNILADQITRNLQITPLNADAKTIQIKFKDKNPLKNADIVNSVCQEFNKYDLERNSEVADKILDFIDNTISSIDLQLSNSENSIEQFKKRNKLVNPDMSTNVDMSRLQQLQSEYFAIEHELNLYSKIRKEIRNDVDISKFLLGLSGRSSDNSIVLQLSKLQELIDQRDQIKLQATESSEVYRSILVRLKSQQSLLVQTLMNEESDLKSKRDSKMQEISSLEAKLGALPEKQTEYARLQRLFSINEKFYAMLLEKKAEFSITRAGYVPQHVILQEARSDTPPVSPKKSLIFSACILIGFLASFILIITRYLLYNEINALEEVGRYTDAALLGIVPKYKREIPISQLLVDKNPKSVISEAFRSIRTNLQFISNAEGAKLIAVTSTISGEGKTFNAINLAGVIAFSGMKVVILDLDMRKPKIHLGFNVENNQGISTLLIGKDTPESCILKSSLANLDFITAGPIPPNPAELIINPNMDALLEQLKKTYDVIIIDLPPVGIVSDGVPMMQKADYPLYILRANYSKKMFIAQINKLMTENKVNNLSIILNGVEMSRLKYGYGYGYSYGYGYGYGYSYGYGYYEDDNDPKGFMDKIRALFIRKP